MKKIINFIIMIIILMVFTFGKLKINAHDSIVNVEYDDCENLPYNDEDAIGDGIDEKWYDLVWYDSVSQETISSHIPENIITLTYYIYDELNASLWGAPIISNRETVINSLREGIDVWNNIYVYDYDGTNIYKKKVINIKEGTKNDHNISIICGNGSNTTEEVAGETYRDGEDIKEENINNGDYIHSHYNKWIIKIYSEFIYSNSQAPTDVIKRTMTHELGHVLGLCDVDGIENTNSENYHHEELLMGYAKDGVLDNRQQNITYKDLAGVAITRGFHTDNDHKWLKASDTYNGKYKLICSICNGVKYVSSLAGYTYDNYGICNNNHTLSSNNMMAVGCNGNKDYIKCKYCRYVSPVEDMVTQNFTCQSVDTTKHIITNSVNGLNYTIYEPHTFTYSIYSSTQHKNTCHCGYEAYERHSITEADYTDGDNIAICIQCKRIVNLNDGMFPVLPTAITKYSINGSFILPNGVVVLVEEDIQSYIDNTLIFYNKEDIPQIE